MYTDEDLENAVEKGIFSTESVKMFRADVLEQRNTLIEDEENFRLLSSFNDIFVVIACGLLLLSVGWITYSVHPAVSMFLVSAFSWGLAEFFVLRRKMALPAVFLLITFVGGLLFAVINIFEVPSESAVGLGAMAASIGAFFHWRRFKVPITVAAGAAALVMFFVSLLISLFPDLEKYITFFMFIGGGVIFFFAMYWDSLDLDRVTGKSDVAFWLHLTAAPLIVHPVFAGLGIFDGNENLVSGITIVCLYVVLTIVSLVIDRRAFMVSSLIYVLVALTNLLKTYGLAGDSFGYVGVLIGFSLLVLSGFWHVSRRAAVSILPEYMKNRVPQVTKRA